MLLVVKLKSIMKIIWKKKVLKILLLLCFISVVPYILIVGLEKTEGNFDGGKHLVIELRSNGSSGSSGQFRYHSVRDGASVYGGRNGPSTYNARRRPHDVPTMVKYCNPPSKLMDGDEGQPPDGYKLKLVTVLIRHGDRNSIHTIHGYDPGKYSCKFNTWYNGTNPKILQYAPTMTQFIGKQPGKSYFLNWALFPNKDQCDTSELTSLGALQHIHNGQFFQKRYITNSSVLFNPKLAYSSQIYVRSTEISRTYQSAVALLYGMMPKFTAAYLNIDNAKNLFFCTPKHALKNDCFCKHGKDLSFYAKKFKKEFSANRTTYHSLRSALADIFDNTVEQLPWLNAALDALAPALCHKFETPCSMWNADKCIDFNLIRDMWDEAITTDGAQTSDPNQYYLKYSSIMLHPILVEIVRRMKDVSEGRQRERFVLYSGHDLTLSPLLMVLGLYNGIWPPLASRFVIELYERQSFFMGSNSHYLKFIYNGVDRTRDVIFCKDKTRDGLCEFELFSEFVFRNLLQRFKYTSYKEACSKLKIT